MPYTDEEYVTFLNNLSPKDQETFKRMKPADQATNIAAWKEGNKQKAVISAMEGDKLQNARVPQEGSAYSGGVPIPQANATAHTEAVTDTLRGNTTQAKDGTPIAQGLGSVEGGDTSITERQAQEAEIAANTKNTSKEPTPEQGASLMASALDGKLDTSDPDKTYMLINAITTALHNTGVSLGNVAAAYTGGTPSNDYQTNEWEKRMSQRAQAKTEASILDDIPNSEEGLRLRAAQISNLNAQEQRSLANQIIKRFYDDNGHFIGDVNSADFKNLATLANQIRNGGGAKDSLLSQLFARFAGFTGF